MTIREMCDEMRLKLSPIVGDSEARAMANIILEDVKGYSPTQLIMYSNRTLLDETVARLRHIVDRIADGEPMQYVIGSARFRGRDFIVNSSVLIPRPETGQLVDTIIDDYHSHKDCRILDIGTGSCCIAISLAIDLPYSKVDAIDVSADAVATAKENVNKYRADVSIIQANAYELDRSPLSNSTYDIIVSNPPYILESERLSIDSRVKDYEPGIALFVPDSRSIEIYKAIARYGKTHLCRDGRLYFEINPLCAEEMKKMLEGEGYENVHIERDYKGNKRFAIAQQP